MSCNHTPTFRAGCSHRRNTCSIFSNHTVTADLETCFHWIETDNKEVSDHTSRSIGMQSPDNLTRHLAKMLPQTWQHAPTRCDWGSRLEREEGGEILADTCWSVQLAILCESDMGGGGQFKELFWEVKMFTKHCLDVWVKICWKLQSVDGCRAQKQTIMYSWISVALSSSSPYDHHQWIYVKYPIHSSERCRKATKHISVNLSALLTRNANERSKLLCAIEITTQCCIMILTLWCIMLCIMIIQVYITGLSPVQGH